MKKEHSLIEYNHSTEEIQVSRRSSGPKKLIQKN